ncbi:hypothetical protein ACPV5O_03125 [Vibrio maritimus]|uniref:hypothetical protein n=1 Tax=Vibrio maritimus TaxID=990268 RepID=UPI0040684E13
MSEEANLLRRLAKIILVVCCIVLVLGEASNLLYLSVLPFFLFSWSSFLYAGHLERTSKEQINKKCRNLTRTIYEKTIEVRHGMKATPEKEIKQLEQFLDFNRCNYRNVIADSFDYTPAIGSSLPKIRLIRTSHTQRFEENIGVDGKSKLRVGHITSARWGVILPSFVQSKPMIISETLSSDTLQVERDQFVEFSPIFPSLKDRFYVQGIDERNVLAVLRPHVKSCIDSLYEKFDNLTFEINEINQLLIHQSEYRILDKLVYSVKDGDEFVKELDAKTELRGLSELIDSIKPLYLQ